MWHSAELRSSSLCLFPISKPDGPYYLDELLGCYGEERTVLFVHITVWGEGAVIEAVA